MNGVHAIDPDSMRVFDRSVLDQLDGLALGADLKTRFIAASRNDLLAGLDALHAALRENDTCRLHERAHEMKGVALQVGLRRLAASCQQLIQPEPRPLELSAQTLAQLRIDMIEAWRMLDDYQREPTKP